MTMTNLTNISLTLLSFFPLFFSFFIVVTTDQIGIITSMHTFYFGMSMNDTHTNTSLVLFRCVSLVGVKTMEEINQLCSMIVFLGQRTKQKKKERRKEKKQFMPISHHFFISPTTHSYSHSCGDKTESAHFRLAFITTKIVVPGSGLQSRYFIVLISRRCRRHRHLLGVETMCKHKYFHSAWLRA